MQAPREQLEKSLQVTREELAKLDKRLKSKDDVGLDRGDPLLVRWELDLARRERTEQKAEQLADALERLGKGDYGLCESCRQPIHPERLEALPGTSLCIECARKTEQNGKASVLALAHSVR